TSSEKGLKEICAMIKQTSYRLKIAAKVDAVDVSYFEQEVQPLIDGEQIEFIGEIGPSEKREFLKKASGLLLWLNWEEPFGLAVIEALASGTPVIVNPRGSMPELIQDGVTGFLVDTLDEMKARLDDARTIQPQQCRHSVETCFSARHMAEEYLSIAEQLVYAQ